MKRNIAPLEMRDACLECWSGRLNLAEALDYMREGISRENGWLLAESPEKVIWEPWRGEIATEALVHCNSLCCFDPGAELRLFRNGGNFYARKIRVSESGEKGLERLSSYVLRKGGKRLCYAEFFQPDTASGILKLRLGRFCGVEVDK